MLTAITSIFLGVFVYSYDGRPEYCEEGRALPPPPGDEGAGGAGGFEDACVTGLTRATFGANWGADYGEYEGEKLSFGAVLAIFFPAQGGEKARAESTRLHRTFLRDYPHLGGAAHFPLLEYSFERGHLPFFRCSVCE